MHAKFAQNLNPLKRENLHLLLADDDEDDRILFQDALNEVCSKTLLNTVNDGYELMHLLKKDLNPHPDVLFLDLNMPRKNGFECLTDIRKGMNLQTLPIIIFSTTAEQATINKVYENGANFYIRKPVSFCQLKTAIKTVLTMDWEISTSQIPKEKFVLLY